MFLSLWIQLVAFNLNKKKRIINKTLSLLLGYNKKNSFFKIIEQLLFIVTKF